MTTDPDLGQDPAPYTARQLLRDLAALPPHHLDLPVDVEGCDCYGPAAGVAVEVLGSRTIVVVERAQP